jgi:uncharacterized membrane protein
VTCEAGRGTIVGGRHNPSEALTQALVPLIAVAILIAVLAVAVYLIRSWLRDNDGPAASAHELLAEYRELHLRGELSDEEFRIIKGRMASRIGGASDLKRNENQKE